MKRTLHLKPGMKISYDYSDESGYIKLIDYRVIDDSIQIEKYVAIFPEDDETLCPDLEYRFKEKTRYTRKDVLRIWNNSHDNVIREGRYDSAIWDGPMIEPE